MRHFLQHPKLKKIAKILAVTLIFLGTPTYLIYSTISESIDCDQLVIDTYELHSGINIPKVGFVNCYYGEELNTRISVYDLKGMVDLERFEQVDTGSSNYLKGITLLTEGEQPTGTSIYLASGERWGTRWTYAVDHRTNRLWAELNY